ncbi:hypothetical protein [Streptomyces sp. NPDC101234]|uniref:hypothetical protein n=1 Tax=Streptomyces sp. NPDC101234 TaxID=3366138 RepID=UPI003824B2DB
MLSAASLLDRPIVTYGESMSCGAWPSNHLVDGLRGLGTPVSGIRTVDDVSRAEADAQYCP